MPPRSRLETRLRHAARLALYGSLTLTIAVGATFVPVTRNSIRASIDTSWHGIDYEQHPAVQKLQAYLRVDTTPEGSELAGARYLADVLREAGIESVVEELPEGKANLWAWLEGEDPAALVLHNHIDTDPIRDREAWKHPPFDGVVEPPWIYGRGAFDMKSVTVAQLEALLEVKRRSERLGRPPARSILFLATGSEEIGSELGLRWVMQQRPELVDRFWAALGEGGVLEATDRASIKYWGTSFAQKRFVQLWACAPTRERLEEMAEDLRRITAERAELRLTEEVRSFLEHYGHTRDHPEYREALAEPHRLLHDRRRFERLPFYLQALFRDEVHALAIEAHPDGGGYRMKVFLHLLPGSDRERLQEELLPAWLTQGVDVTVREPVSTVRGSPLDHPVFAAIDRSIVAQHGDVDRGPYFLSLYTNDGRFFREAGIPYYGFTPFLFLTSDSMTIAGPNERIAVPEFVRGVELYRDVVLRLTGFEPGEE